MDIAQFMERCISDNSSFFELVRETASANLLGSAILAPSMNPRISSANALYPRCLAVILIHLLRETNRSTIVYAPTKRWLDYSKDLEETLHDFVFKEHYQHNYTAVYGQHVVLDFYFSIFYAIWQAGTRIPAIIPNTQNHTGNSKNRELLKDEIETRFEHKEWEDFLGRDNKTWRYLQSDIASYLGHITNISELRNVFINAAGTLCAIDRGDENDQENKKIKEKPLNLKANGRSVSHLSSTVTGKRLEQLLNCMKILVQNPNETEVRQLFVKLEDEDLNKLGLN